MGQVRIKSRLLLCTDRTSLNNGIWISRVPKASGIPRRVSAYEKGGEYFVCRLCFALWSDCILRLSDVIFICSDWIRQDVRGHLPEPWKTAVLTLYIDDENDIGKRYVYICRCGWLDAEHIVGYYTKYIKIYYKMRAWKKGSVFF